jgi:hypothetical protein
MRRISRAMAPAIALMLGVTALAQNPPQLQGVPWKDRHT